jgi:hypothetical protein
MQMTRRTIDLCKLSASSFLSGILLHCTRSAWNEWHVIGATFRRYDLISTFNIDTGKLHSMLRALEHRHGFPS